ncbi:MAG: hypothetical protein HUU55_22810 [Myxococcales bacterium]|nr:hypothetical protein [Myxococcales bacterium]
MMNLEFSVVAPAIILTVTLVAAAYTTWNSDPRPTIGQVKTSAAAELIRSHQEREPAWRAKAARQFPGDVWSQDDDFFLSEYRWAKSFWKKHAVAPGIVLMLLDTGLRSRDAEPNVVVSACKPRLAYE